MPDTPASWLERYQPYRRPAEIGFCVLVLVIQLLANSVTTWIDLRTAPFAVPQTWDLSSNLTIAALIPLLIAFERRFPLRSDTLARNLLQLFGYEYLKDVRSDMLIVSAILGYRLLLLRMQGEARVLDEAEPAAGAAPPAQPPARPERFLVRKLRKEFLIQAGDIDWLQAQGNYIGMHVGGHDDLLRSTLSDFLQQLDGGDVKLRMKDGSQVPCSRRYRDGLGGG